MVDAVLGTTSGVFRVHDGALEPLGMERPRDACPDEVPGFELGRYRCTLDRQREAETYAAGATASGGSK